MFLFIYFTTSSLVYLFTTSTSLVKLDESYLTTSMDLVDGVLLEEPQVEPL